MINGPDLWIIAATKKNTRLADKEVLLVNAQFLRMKKLTS